MRIWGLPTVGPGAAPGQGDEAPLNWKLSSFCVEWNRGNDLIAAFVAFYKFASVK